MTFETQVFIMPLCNTCHVSNYLLTFKTSVAISIRRHSTRESCSVHREQLLSVNDLYVNGLT